MNIEEAVAAYLADCAAVPWLARKYHPTAAGCVKMIPHSGDRAVAAAIKAAVERALARDGTSVVR